MLKLNSNLVTLTINLHINRFNYYTTKHNENFVRIAYTHRYTNFINVMFLKF